ncbi:methyltransferase domain-containing protein [Alloactinosynnema sp. L-07]|uniref:class I SAM-dependent methyltransferase n=1 Tax=Alloactinosynnema sp. L-07 TaxID=1653480 RepID=UPI0006B42F62|nr:methyltransferase domain-containing protein [Alloactinosynnema sp. L-07]
MTATVNEETVGEFTAPTPEEVGVGYDEYLGLHKLIAAEFSLHIGAWSPIGERKPARTLLDLSNRTQDKQTEHHIKTLAMNAGEHLLDIGCGAGLPAIEFVKASGVRATGINVSRGQLAEAVKTAEAEGVTDRVDFQYGDAMALEFPDETFDSALSIEVFAHLSDRQKAFHEAARVLKPGGYFLVSDFTLRGEPTEEQLTAYLQTWHCMPPITPAKIMEMAATAGFELIQVENMTQNTAFTGELMGLLYGDRRAEIVDLYGAEAVAEMDYVIPLVRSFFREHLGSYLFLLRKPA